MDFLSNMSTDESVDQEHIIKALLSRLRKLRRQRDYLKERVEFFKDLYFRRCRLTRHLRNVIKRKDKKIRRLEKILEELRSMKLAEIHLSVWPFLEAGMLSNEEGLCILEGMLRDAFRDPKTLEEITSKIQEYLEEHRDFFSENNPFIELEVRIKERELSDLKLFVFDESLKGDS